MGGTDKAVFLGLAVTELRVFRTWGRWCVWHFPLFPCPSSSEKPSPGVSSCATSVLLRLSLRVGLQEASLGGFRAGGAASL